MMKKTRSDWLVALQIGMIGGLGAIFMSLVGMVEEFSKRDIIAGVIEMGQTLILVDLLATGYLASRRVSGGKGIRKTALGALAGAVTSAMLYALVLLIPPLELRTVFYNASPTLIKILALGQAGVAAPLVMLAVGAAIGAVGSGIQQLPAGLRRAVLLALSWVSLLGLLQDLLRVTLSFIPGANFVVGWMFAARNQKGLSILGAVVVFAAITFINYRWASRGVSAGRWLGSRPAKEQQALRWGGIALGVALMILLPSVLGPYLSEVTNQVGLFILMGLGLNIVVGFAGLLDLGYVAFWAIGAYVVGVLTSSAIGPNAGQIVFGPQLSFWIALPIAVMVSVMAGLILGVPVLNMRGDYLAIVTLGFGEIIRILAGSDFLKPYIGGSQGIVEVGVGRIGTFAFDRPQTLYYMVVVACLLAAFISWRLRDARMGRAWKAIREDEDVAQAMGIHLVATKLLAFATGAAFAGLSGAIFASKIGSIYPHSFKLLVSINVLSLIIVGGMGSLPGVFVGGLILVGLPELLREFSEYRLLLYGALLVVMMLTRPEGFMPEATRRREFHEEAAPGAEPDAVSEPVAST